MGLVENLSMDKFDKVVEQIPRLRRYAHALVGNPDYADDLVQDCLARAISRLSLWKDDSDMRAWLFTIMHNVFINECRKQCKQPQCFPLSKMPERPQNGSEPDQAIMISDLENGLRYLHHEQREVILLIGLEGLSYQQVADVLRIPKGTVMSRLHRGRSHLRNWLDGETKDTHGLRSV